MADYELAKAYVQIIPTTKGISANLAGALGAEGDAAGAASGSGIAAGLKRTLPGVAKVAAAGLVAATGTMVAFGKSSVSAGSDFDNAMSQVMATMGYTAEDLRTEGSIAYETLQKLRGFAQEMGATTAFSATQASEALNYMALAGYDVEKSMDMLPVVLDLAASGAMDLADASDMVTDAQSAFNLSNEETKTMVDQMAKTASKSNTSVSQLGEAYLKIGATARTIKGGTLELSTILGVLADNGIKGTEGGTHLRNMLLSLQNPTDDGAIAMKKLGLEVYDSEGNMRSMVDIIGDMQDAMEGMSDEEKTNYLTKMFNKTDLAAVNALLGTSKKRFAELGSAIDDASGAAQEMAKVQLDNLAGDVTLFKSALEGVQIAFSDKLTPDLRDFVQLGTEGLGKIQKGLEEDGIAGAAEALGDVIGDIGQKFVDNLPDLVDAGAKLMVSMSKGLVEAVPSLIGAIPDIIGTLTESIVSLLDAKLFVEVAGAIIKGSPKIIESIFTGFGQILGGATKFLNELLGITHDNREEIEAEVAKENEALKTFVDSLSSIEPQLADYNSFVSESGETLRELNDKISEYEGKITDTIQAALEEQGKLRAEDLQDIAEYTQALLEAEEQKLTLYREQQKAQLTKLMLETGEIERKDAEQHLANVSAALEEVNKLTDDEYTSRIQLIQNKYAAMGQVGSQAYNEELLEAQEWHDKALAENQSYYDQAVVKLEANAREWVKADAEKWDELANNFDRYVVDQNKSYIRMDGSTREFLRAADVEFAEALLKMDQNATNGLLAMAVSFKKGGAKLDEETETMVRNVLNSFDDLPEELDEAGKDSLLGFIYGLEGEIPQLKNASEMSSQEIINTIKRFLEISSPSRVMIKLGGYVTDGLASGISGGKGTLDKAMSRIGSAITASRSWGMANPSTALTAMGKSMMTGLQAGITNKQSSLVSATKTVGQQMANGVKSGFENRESAIKSSISSVLNRIVKSAKANLQIASPSKVFANIGEMIGAGMTVGIEESSFDAIDAAEDMALGITSVARGVLESDYSRAYGAAGSGLSSAISAAVNSGVSDGRRIDDLILIVRAVYDRMERLQVVLDSGQLVGGIKNQMDDAIGANGSYARRGMAL